ncbi:MAG: nucleotide exchange factor GrpE [Candidatus Methanoplasma sp.]|jgi:molecular chaperone GrpE|nr:nucleotide exchange factor GrpE [Candidatus Methanoplasma sp.]
MTDKSVNEAEASRKDELAEAKAKADEYLDAARRIQADFDNFRKRTQKEIDDGRRYATERISGSLLTVADDLGRALESSGDLVELREGISNIQRNLMKVLEENGVCEIPTCGGFDPAVHEALCVTEGDEDDRIAEVYQKGYRMHDRVIRCAKVRVTKKPKEQKEEESEQDV